MYKSPTFTFVASILRAADALEFDQFRAFAISYLQKMWTANLSDLSHTLDNAADAVLLARRCNVNGMLKRALYELLISEGFKQSEADRIDPGVEDGENKSVLSTSDFSLLVHAREQLTTFWMQKAIPPPQPTICKSLRNSSAYRTCAVTRHRTHELYKELVHDSKTFERYRFDPIWGLEILRSAPWIEGEVWPSTQPREGLLLPTTEIGYLCSACAQVWRAIWRAEKIKLWHDIGTWLGNGNK